MIYNKITEEKIFISMLSWQPYIFIYVLLPTSRFTRKVREPVSINILVIFLFVLLNQNTFNHTRFREVYQAYIS